MVTIDVTTHIQAPIDRCFDLARSIEVHLLGTQSTAERAVAGTRTGLMNLGDSVRWKARHFGVSQHLTSKITQYDRPTYFQDTMQQGAFRSMQHDHFFTPAEPGSTNMRDVFRFAAPLPILGLIAERLVLRRYMTNFLKHRNHILKEVAESPDWQSYLKAI